MRKNALTMRGILEKTWLFCYSLPIADAQSLLPSPLELVTHNDRALLGVVVCRLRSMRPAGVPAELGIGYWHIGYRLYVRYGEAAGIYFIASEANSRIMSSLGNLMTDYHFHPAWVRVEETEDAVEIKISSDLGESHAHVDRLRPPRLAENSAFPSLALAEEALMYEPYGISVAPDGSVQSVKIIRDESEWQHRLVDAPSAEWAVLKDVPLTFELCFQMRPISYEWSRAVTVQRADNLLRQTE